MRRRWQEEIATRGELAQRLYAPVGRVVDSVFFGGGTPTYLPPDTAVYPGASRAAQSSRWRRQVEVTVEANPDTLTEGYIAALQAAGVNRLSIGLQATPAAAA